MNRRKSVIQPSGGGGTFSERKIRPFGPFKRETQRDQIPEVGPTSPTSLGPNRPEASSTPDIYDERSRSPSEVQTAGRQGPEIATLEPRPPADNTNGVSSQQTHVAPSDAPNVQPVQVCVPCETATVQSSWLTGSNNSALIQKATRSGPKRLMR